MLHKSLGILVSIVGAFLLCAGLVSLLSSDVNYIIILLAFFISFIAGWITSSKWTGILPGVILGTAFGILRGTFFSTGSAGDVIVFGFLGILFGFISGWLGSLVPYPPRVQLPSTSGFLWTLLFGVIGGGLASLFFPVGYSSSGDVSIFPIFVVYEPGLLVIVCLIIGSAGFITGRLAGTRILTGCIAGIIIVAEQVYISVFARHGLYLYEKLYALPFLELGIIIAAAALLGFIGGWLGMLRQE